MAQYTYKIPGFRVAGYKIPVPPLPVATRAEVAAYIDSISNSAISLSVSGDTATFTFPAATPKVARAIANGLGDGNLVTIGAVRNTGYSDNILLGYSPGVEQPAKNRKQDRGWNYRDWIGNYWPSNYTFQRPIQTCDSCPNKYGKRKLTIVSKPFYSDDDYHGRKCKLSYNELITGSVTRDISLLKSLLSRVDITEYYIGLIYWNTEQTPCKFKMVYNWHSKE